MLSHFEHFFVSFLLGESLLVKLAEHDLEQYFGLEVSF
jgi:hypothetical protein